MSSTRKIGVLLGGLSVEKDISLRAGEAVLGALHQLGHEAQAIYVDRDIDLALRQARIDAAILAVRGRYSADGCLQGLLEFHGIPYTGSGVLASGLAMNRAKAKDLLRMGNLPVSVGYQVRADQDSPPAESHGSFGFPVMVRPVAAALLISGSLVHDEVELEGALESIFRLDNEALVERLPPGQSVTVAILDGMALGAKQPPRSSMWIQPKSAARTKTANDLVLSPARHASVLRLAMQAYDTLGCEGPACVELMVSDRMNETIVDIDTCPLLHPQGLYASIAYEAGLDYVDLVEELLKGARLRAHGHRHNRRTVQASFTGPDRRADAVTEAH
jgi:D-alanine-D-alanine ligase